MIEALSGARSTRRRLLLSAFTGVAGTGTVVKAWSASAQGSYDGGWIGATLEAVAPPDRITVRTVQDAVSFDVGVTASTKVNRDGPATISDFSVGETVTLLLEDGDGQVRTARNVESVYFLVEDAAVVSRSAAHLQVRDIELRATQGERTSRIGLTRRTRVPDRFEGGRFTPGRPVSQIRSGDVVSVVGRYDRTQAAFMAFDLVAK